MRPAPGYADYRTPIAGLYNGSSGHARRRRRVRHPRLAGGPRGARRQEARACGGSGAARWTHDAGRSRPCSAPGRWRWWAPVPAPTASARGWSSRPNGVRRVCIWSIRATTASASCRACRRSPTSTSPSTWCCSGCPTPRWSTSWTAAAADGCTVGGAVRVRARPAREDRGDRHRRRHGAVRGGLHGLREQRARRAGPGLPGAGSAAARRRQPRHPFRLGVLDAAAGPPRVRLPARGVVRTGARHRHRRLRRLRAGRSRNADHRAAAGDASRGPAAAAGPCCAPPSRTCRW